MTDGGNLLLLDEPTNHLDLASQEILEEALLSYEGTIIPVSHDRTLLGAVSTQVWEIKEGRLSVFTENYDGYKKRIAAEQAQAQANAGQKKRRSSKKRDQDREGKRQGDMSVLEREIEQLESKLKQVEEGLLAASSSGDQKKMARLGKEHGQLNRRLDERYAKWGKVLEEGWWDFAISSLFYHVPGLVRDHASPACESRDGLLFVR